MTLRAAGGVVNIRPHGTRDGTDRRPPVAAPPAPSSGCRIRETERNDAGRVAPTGGGVRRRGGEESVMNTGRTHKEQVKVHIRWMIRRDMPEVLQTEQESFEYAWTEEDFLKCLRQRNCIGMVAEQGERVVGFMIYELHKAKLHILNFAVHPQYRRGAP